ncbi:MAG: hypothetical protein ACW981_15860 [Candidatus Hodarchaeales archaeon]
MLSGSPQIDFIDKTLLKNFSYLSHFVKHDQDKPGFKDYLLLTGLTDFSLFYILVNPIIVIFYSLLVFSILFLALITSNVIFLLLSLGLSYPVIILGKQYLVYRSYLKNLPRMRVCNHDSIEQNKFVTYCSNCGFIKEKLPIQPVVQRKM